MFFSADATVALKCGHRSPRHKSTIAALRSAPARKTSRNPPCGAIHKERLDFAHPVPPSEHRSAMNSSSASDLPPAAREPVRNIFPPQGLNAATPSAHNRETFVLDGTRRGITNDQIPPFPPTALTISFSVDPLNSPFAQAGGHSLTLARNISQEPPTARIIVQDMQ